MVYYYCAYLYNFNLNSSMKVNKLVAYLLEEGIKEFRKDYAGLVKNTEQLPVDR